MTLALTIPLDILIDPSILADLTSSPDDGWQEELITAAAEELGIEWLIEHEGVKWELQQ